MMAELTANRPIVIFEGFGDRTTLMGATVADFLVPSIEREFAIAINDPVLVHALQELGLPDTPENRDTITRELGRLLLYHKLHRGYLEPTNFYGLRLFKDHPGIVDELRDALAVAA